MQNTIRTTGRLVDPTTIKIDQALTQPPGKVRITLEAIEDASSEPPPSGESWASFEQRLRERQEARGHVPSTKEEIDAYLEEERNSWDR